MSPTKFYFIPVVCCISSFPLQLPSPRSNLCNHSDRVENQDSSMAAWMVDQLTVKKHHSSFWWDYTTRVLRLWVISIAMEKLSKNFFKATVAMISISKTEQMLLPLCTVAQHPRVMVQGKNKNPIFHQLFGTSKLALAVESHLLIGW